jgi:succinate-semialdehyde dehydrogenase/glutarate-semialdehyde dehydrogenase
MTPISDSAARCSRGIQRAAGMMFINNIDWSDAELPFGGMGIQEFANEKLARFAKLVAPG